MFATGPRAVGFTIVWPEGVIFRSMMTYHVQFLLLVLAVQRDTYTSLTANSKQRKHPLEKCFGSAGT